MLATLVCVFTSTVFVAAGLSTGVPLAKGICCFAAGGLARAAATAATSIHKTHYGGAATFFVFLFTASFGATWLTVPWLYPAEIFPLQTRAKVNAWGLVGWFIGNGWTVLLLPTIFNALNEKTLYIFGAVNALSIVVVWALYPETNQRMLEDMKLVFASDSIFNREAEKAYKILSEENPELVRAAKRNQSVVDPETGLPKSIITSKPRSMSLDANAFQNRHKTDKR